MKIKWLIEDYEHDSSLAPFIDEIKKQRMVCEVVKYEPWKNGEFNQFKDNDCVIVYGTLNLGRQLQKQKKWIPGVYCNFKNFCCHTYYSYWAKYLLNQDYIMLPMMEILRKREEIFTIFSRNGQIFIRPNSGAKCFTGQLVEYERLDKEFDLFSNYAGKDLDQIITIISSPKKILKEWRITIADKKVIAFSQYKENNRLDIKKETDCEAICLADKIAKEKWQPDKIYTLDICRVEDEYSLLEVNSFSCSGLYRCSVEPIVKEVSRVALEEWKEYNE